MDRHQFATRANRWTLLQLIGGTFSSRRAVQGWSMQSSPTDWCPNWQSWARLHPSAAGSSISCQKPSLRVRVTPHPHPTHPHPSASAETFSNKKMASALWRNLDHTHTSCYHCSMQSVYWCVFVMPAAQWSHHLHPENHQLPSSLPSMNFFATTASERPKTPPGTYPLDVLPLPSQDITCMNCCPQANVREKQKQGQTGIKKKQFYSKNSTDLI